MTSCTSCGHRFSASKALCEDWKDPERSFGCPACGTFFVRDLKPSLSAPIIGGIVGGGIATPAVMLLAEGVRGADSFAATMASIILGSVAVLAAILARAATPKLRVSPFRVDVEGSKAPQSSVTPER